MTLILWCLLPLFAIAFHFTYGSRLLLAEDAVKLRLLAQHEERAAHYKKAVERYLAAEDAAHPKDCILRARLRIDAARALMLAGSPLEAAEQIDLFLNTKLEKPLPENIIAEAKSTLALSLYYATYALRLESSSPKRWENEIQEATSLFEELYQSEIKSPGAPLAAFYARNLEATIALTRARQAELASEIIPPPALAAINQGVASKKGLTTE